MKFSYRDINFRPATLALIAKADAICQAYARQGYSLTLRQLYYQLVATGVLPNKQTEYKRLGSIVDDARYAGLIDWNHVVDRTRTLRALSHWGNGPETPPESNARDFVENVMPQFRIEKWATQPLRMEVWIEKDALIDVIARPANGLDIAYFACRGYNSTSNAWAAAKRIEGYYDKGAKRVIILHLGDHDPEGIDMTRDIETRFRTFLVGDDYPQGDEWDTTEDAEGGDVPSFEIRRIALNMDQVQQYNPPPNPAKETSSRYQGYVERFGIRTSWELDALDPPTIDALVRAEVEAERDEALWQIAVVNEQRGKAQLKGAADNWREVVDYLNESGLLPDEVEDTEPENDDENE
jgi:hypothetical protein